MTVTCILWIGNFSNADCAIWGCIEGRLGDSWHGHSSGTLWRKSLTTLSLALTSKMKYIVLIGNCWIPQASVLFYYNRKRIGVRAVIFKVCLFLLVPWGCMDKLLIGEYLSVWFCFVSFALALSSNSLN